MEFGKPPADFPVEAGLVQRLVASQFPQYSGLALQEVESGWDNSMFRLGKDLAVRLPRREDSLACTQAEIEWLPLLAKQLPLPTPAPLHFGQPDRDFPHPWTIVPWLAGKPADLFPPAASEPATLARFFEALHKPAPANAPVNPYRGVPLPDMDRRRQSSGDPIEPHLTRHQIEQWNLSLEEDCPGSALWIHGDLHPMNALTEGGRFAAILDWGDLTSGDPACDLARFYMFFQDPDAIWAATRDPGVVRRAQGWALHFGVTHLRHGEHGQPRHGEIGKQTLETLERASLMR